MKYCKKCGTAYEGSPKFCKKCGALLVGQEKKEKKSGKFFVIITVLAVILAVAGGGVFLASQFLIKDSQEEEMQEESLSEEEDKKGQGKEQQATKEKETQKEEAAEEEQLTEEEKAREEEKKKEEEEQAELWKKYEEQEKAEAAAQAEAERKETEAAAQGQTETITEMHQVLENSDVESEVLRIRVIFTECIEKSNNGTYQKVPIEGGYNAWFDGDELRMINTTADTTTSSYERIFNYENGKLIFAYLKQSGTESRLYYKDGNVFRWSYPETTQIQDNNFGNPEFVDNGIKGMELGMELYNTAMSAK
ncbi:MAG: hypothetical protein ACI4EO_06465 [Blautia sp.]